MLKTLTLLSRNCSKLIFKRIEFDGLNTLCCTNLCKCFSQQRFYSENNNFFDETETDEFFDQHYGIKTCVDAEELEEREYTKIITASGLGINRRNSIASDNVLVIHPKIRWGENSAPANTTPELQLEEAVTLCKTLPGFNVVR